MKTRIFVHYVYMLACYRGEKLHCFYTGFTNDIKRRLAEHERNAAEGKRKKFTGRFDKVKLVWWEKCGSRVKAQEREKEIKRMNSSQKRALVEDKAPDRETKRI